jgi:hypothetical protein
VDAINDGPLLVVVLVLLVLLVSLLHAMAGGEDGILPILIEEICPYQ